MNHKYSGFSLIETLVGLLISLILVLLTATIASSLINQAKIQIDHSQVQKESKFSSVALSSEILNAGNGFFLDGKNICAYGILANTTSGASLLNSYPIYFEQDTSTTVNGVTSDRIQITSFYTKNIMPPYRMMNSVSNLTSDIELNKLDYLSVGDKILIGNTNQKIPCILGSIQSIDTNHSTIKMSTPSTVGSPFTFNYKEDSFIYKVSDSTTQKDFLQSWIYFLDTQNHQLKYFNQLTSSASQAHVLMNNVYFLSAYYNYDLLYHTYNSAESTWYKKENGLKLLDNIPYNATTAQLTNYDKRKIKGYKIFILKKGDKKISDCNLMNKDIYLLKTTDFQATPVSVDISKLVTDWKCWNFSLLQGENILLNGVMNE